MLKQIREVGRRLISKRAGTVISRPIINAEAWAEWLTSIGVPEPVAAADLAVTVISAVGDVAVIVDPTPSMVMSTSGAFVKTASGQLAFIWYDWGYSDRLWTLQSLAGAQCAYSSTAMLVLSAAVGDFELTDEHLATAPRALVLGGERTEALTDVALVITKSKGGRVTVTEPRQRDADAALGEMMGSDEADPRHIAVLADLSKGRSVAVMDARELPEATRERIGLLKAQPDPEPTPEPEVKPKAKGFVAADAERRIAYGWATVATKNGEHVVDYEGDTISVDAMHDLAHLIVKGARAGDFEHDGVHCNEIVECMVFDKPLQDALGIDLGHEGVLIGTHIPDDANWARVKDGSWEQSIEAEAVVEPN